MSNSVVLLNKSKCQVFASTIADKYANTKGKSIHHRWDWIQSTIIALTKAILGKFKGGRKCNEET